MREYHNAKVETAESFWFDLTTTFRPENVARLPKRELQLWRDLIERKGVKNRKGRVFPIKVAFIEVITASSLPVPETLPYSPHRRKMQSTGMVLGRPAEGKMVVTGTVKTREMT
jgi:hypothetical protein